MTFRFNHAHPVVKVYECFALIPLMNPIIIERHSAASIPVRDGKVRNDRAAATRRVRSTAMSSARFRVLKEVLQACPSKGKRCPNADARKTKLFSPPTPETSANSPRSFLRRGKRGKSD
jgi:hypothetical protein